MPIKLPVKRLQKLCDPYETNPWGKQRITRAKVRAAIEAKSLESEPMSNRAHRRRTYRYHIERIAWLVVNGWEDAIEVDIGVPALGCHAELEGFCVIWDGNHRLAAAIYRGDLEIMAGVSGDIGYGKKLFGVDITER